VLKRAIADCSTVEKQKLHRAIVRLCVDLRRTRELSAPSLLSTRIKLLGQIGSEESGDAAAKSSVGGNRELACRDGAE